jgi:protein-S-isoprenylcysteine O-methyltransferase Ste14
MPSIKAYKIIGLTGLVTLIIGVLTVAIALLQLNINLSPFPSPKSNSSLIKTGLYKFIRHPIYTGIILTTFGYGLYTDSFYKILISIGLYILFYFKSEYEEERLTKKFTDYKIYKKSTGRFFPQFRTR